MGYNPPRSPELIKARWAQRRKLMQRASEMRAQGKKLREIAETLDISVSVVWQWLNYKHPRGAQRKAAS